MTDIQLNGQSITATSTSGTTAPASGTSEVWSVATLAAGIPSLSQGQTYALVDATPGASTAQLAEVIRVTSLAAASTSITATRGADNTTPVAHSTGATYNIVVVASALTYPSLPYYAPQGLQYAETWDPRLACYNVRAQTIHKVRAAIKKLAAGSLSMNVLNVGDSTLSDFNGTTYTPDFTIPRQMGKALAKMIGDVPFVDGYKRVMQAFGVVSPEWTLTGACLTGAASSNSLLISSGAGTATWVSLDAGTSVEVLHSNLSTTGIAWTIDGVAQTALAATGASTMHKTTVTGLTNKIHTIVISPIAGQSLILGGAWTYNPSITSLRMHNLAFGGARVNSGSTGQNLSDVTSNGLGTIIQAEATALGLTWDLLLVCAGNNDIFQSVAVATIGTGFTNIVGYWPTVQPILVHPPMVPGTSSTLFDSFSGSFFTLAETLNCMHFDWNAYDNTTTSYTADGLAGADNIHPTDAERQGLGRHIAHIVADMTSPAERSYQLNESGGVYPPRPPSAAAGQVNYTGPDQPTDWLSGDTWDDMP